MAALAKDDPMRSSIEEIERSLEKNPTQTALWLRYAEYWENTDEVNALAVYNDAVRRCPHIELWRQYITYCKKCVTVKGVVAIFHAAIDVLAQDHRCGELFLEYLALLKAVWNYQWKYRHELILDDPIEQAGITFDADAESSLATKCGGNLPLTADEEEAIKWIAKKAPSDSYISVKTKLSLEHIRRLFRQAVLTPSSCTDRLMRAYEIMEDHIAGSKNVLANAPDRDGTVRDFYSRVAANKHVYDKLVVLYKGVDTLQLPQAEVSQLSKTLPKASQLVKWMDICAAFNAIIAYERGNPCKLEVQGYQTRVTFLYQNVLLVCTYFSEFWYSFYSFLYTFSPIKALQVLKIATEKLPNDLFLRLAYAACFEELVYKKKFNATVLGNILGTSTSTATSGGGDTDAPPANLSLHEAMQNLEGVQMSELMQEMDLLEAVERAESATAMPSIGGNAGGDEHAAGGVSTSSSKTKYNMVSSLYDHLLQEFDGEQYSLALIHYLNFIRRQGGAHAYREFFLKKVLIDSHQKLTWEVYASQALVEYHCFHEKSRCAKIYKIGLDRFRTLETYEPALVASFINFLVSVNDIPAARDELTLAIQKCYQLLREVHFKGDTKTNEKAARMLKEKQKLQTGFKFLFEKLVRLEQSYGEESLEKLLHTKNQILLENVPDAALSLEPLDAEEEYQTNNFLNASLTSILDVRVDQEGNGMDEDNEEKKDEPKGKKGRGKRKRREMLAGFESTKDPFRSDKACADPFHLDTDYNKPNFLRANLLSTVLQSQNSSFLSCSAVLPFNEALSRFRFQHLSPAVNKLNPAARGKHGHQTVVTGGAASGSGHPEQAFSSSAAVAAGKLVERAPSVAGGPSIDATMHETTPTAAGTTAAHMTPASSGVLLDSAVPQDEIALMVKRRMLAQLDNDSDDDDSNLENNTELGGGAAGVIRKSSMAATGKARVTRPDTSRMHSFNPTNAIVMPTGHPRGVVANVLPKVIRDLQQMLPSHKVLKGSAPDVDYLMSVLQTVEIPPLPLEQFTRTEPGLGNGNRGTDSGAFGTGGGIFGGNRVSSLDENTNYMHAIGGSVHNFLIEGAVDDTRYRSRGSGANANGGSAANGASHSTRPERRVKKGKKEEQDLEEEGARREGVSQVKERINVKRRKINEVVKAEQIGAS
ncbi:unnamed protein product [Amoebophrya sp. A25]|nr:unnamed protein product [Amoebophrya sp. A25]|eukprot:GSA25T00009356001.1